MSTESDNEILKLQNELAEIRAEYQSFVYAVSHDLSAPFRQIEGFVHIIEQENNGEFDEDTQRHFNFVVKASDKGVAILDSLLAYSRLVNSEFSRSTVDCNLIVREVEEELSAIIKQTGANIQYTDLPLLFGDEKLLSQLFYHVIHNGLHYQIDGASPVISIISTELERHWQFCIKDNGIGFREKMAKKIFIALRRGVSDAKYSGKGMGLTIARSVVQRHGGKIWTTSVPDEGSEFYFTIAKGDTE